MNDFLYCGYGKIVECKRLAHHVFIECHQLIHDSLIAIMVYIRPPFSSWLTRQYHAGFSVSLAPLGVIVQPSKTQVCVFAASRCIKEKEQS